MCSRPLHIDCLSDAETCTLIHVTGTLTSWTPCYRYHCSIVVVTIVDVSGISFILEVCFVARGPYFLCDCSFVRLFVGNVHLTKHRSSIMIIL